MVNDVTGASPLPPRPSRLKTIFHLSLIVLGLLSLVGAFVGLLFFTNIDPVHAHVPEIQKTLTRYKDLFISTVFAWVGLIFLLATKISKPSTSRHAFFYLSFITGMSLSLLQMFGILLIGFVLALIPIHDPWVGLALALSPAPFIILGFIGILFALIISAFYRIKKWGPIGLLVTMFLLLSWQSVEAFRIFHSRQAEQKATAELVAASPTYGCIAKQSKEEWQRCVFDTVTSEAESQKCIDSAFKNPLYYYPDEAENICRLANDVNVKGKVDMKTCLHFSKDEDQYAQSTCANKLISELTLSDSISICEEFYGNGYYPKYFQFHLNCLEKFISLHRQAGSTDAEIANLICPSESNLDYYIANTQQRASLKELCPLIITNVKVVWPDSVNKLFTSDGKVSISWDTATATNTNLEIQTDDYTGPIKLNETEYKTHHDISFTFDERFGSGSFSYTILACTAPTNVHCTKYANNASYMDR